MCALFGWLDCKHIVSHKVLKKLTQALANAAEERGTDAAGISYVKNGRITIYKRPKPAHKIKFNIPENTVAVMGHTRLATQGDKEDNYNNHPFFGRTDKTFAFAHNGVLYNDTVLRKSHNLPKTNIETDSYVAVQLIEQQKKLDFNSLRNMAEDVMGNFVFTILDENNTLYFVKGNNPLYLIYLERLGLYIYASTKSIMDKALKTVGLQSENRIIMQTCEGDIISINSSGEIDSSRFTPEDYSFLHTSRNRCNIPQYAGWYDWEDDDEYCEYTDEEELLIDMCNCFGVDEDDVLLLLDYGYTAVEIEEMFMDTDLLLSAIQEIKHSSFYDNLA
ncbi:MAG: class II glutamine amidotransferase [Ruminococcus flavefaciens]|nr:class II glutamine amidotransferase [Ruminococcus flavefaciens]